MAATFAPDTMAFVVCLVVIVVDRMGSKFTEPAQFPYSQELGISLPRLSLIHLGAMVRRCAVHHFWPG